MGGIFGVISTKQCRNDLFYGVDYHSHLGTRRGGMAVYNGDGIFARDIHSLENSYFRVKFEDDLYKYTGNLGIGVISDTDAQPIVVNSHLGRFAIVTVGKICNIADLEKEMLSQNKNFTELSSGKTNPTELIAQIITCSPSFEEGIKSVQQKVKGSWARVPSLSSLRTASSHAGTSTAGHHWSSARRIQRKTAREFWPTQ